MKRFWPFPIFESVTLPLTGEGLQTASIHVIRSGLCICNTLGKVIFNIIFNRWWKLSVVCTNIKLFWLLLNCILITSPYSFSISFYCLLLQNSKQQRKAFHCPWLEIQVQDKSQCFAKKVQDRRWEDKCHWRSMLKNQEGYTLPACAVLRKAADDGAKGVVLPRSTETGQCSWVTDSLTLMTNMSDTYNVMHAVLPHGTTWWCLFF